MEFSIKLRDVLIVGIFIFISVLSGFSSTLSWMVNMDFHFWGVAFNPFMVCWMFLICASLYSAFKRDDKWFYAPLVSFILLTLLIFSYFMCMIPENAFNDLGDSSSEFDYNFTDVNIHDVDTGVNAGPLNNFLSIFLHNSSKAILYFILGFTIILPYFLWIVESESIAILMGIIHVWKWKGALFVLGCLHCYLEFPALILSFIAGANLSRYVFKAIIEVIRTRRIRGNFREVKGAVMWGLKLLGISITLLFLAAILETWWSPWWAHHIFP
ncbi:hypothetical protein MTCT_0069 [Methanothermobacter sp. CaT2]|uniref:stage II sporulation protein M n=1 Tax=Methanothermobacter sp. CaT2 TaxID=866790 RepID=UPI0002CCEDA4|nr:stage II sporulation protein M [Methanothermobacter sp. CaT2]BAM69318.1 hypothetical protein MTCT_0069 [Methanothermobacter sp. CaT2]